MSPPPPKPWNNPANISANVASHNFQPDSDPRLKFDAQYPTAAANNWASTAPPLPPRPTINSNMMGMSSASPYGSSNFYNPSAFGSPYGGFNSGMYGGGGGGYYGAGGSPYGMYNRFGYDHGESPVMRIAEQQSRDAFQSVETFVQTFTSISAMLESALAAVYSSFRAVVGVADQFSRLKTHFQHLITTLTIFRSIRWILRKILVLLRVKPPAYAEDVWQKAAGVQSLSTELLPDEVTPRWPNLLFFAVAIGGPWLIWKLLARVVANVEESKKWATGEDDHFVAVAQYGFQKENPNEVSFEANDELKIAPKHLQPSVRGWLLASRDGTEVGLVPASYLKILGKRKGNPLVAQQQSLIRQNLQRQTDLKSEWPETVSADGTTSASLQ